MLITVNTPKPHSIEQQILMEFFLRSKHELLVMPCGTKFGKTLGASAGMVNAMSVKKNTRYRWVGPIYEQAKIGFDCIREILPPPPYTDINIATQKIAIPANKSEVKIWHGQKPTSLEGAACDGYILDEAAKMSKEVYDSAYTTTTRTAGKFALISTPLGKNYFYHMAMECKESMEWHLKRGKVPPKLFITAPTSANPYIPKERIEEARRFMTDRLFRQFYLAEFMDESTTFVNYRNCIFGQPLEFMSDREYWFDPDIAKKKVVIGADWGKKKDYTVFHAIDYTANPPRVVGFLRFNGMAYTSAVVELMRFAKMFKEVSVIYHDATGLGDVINDLMVDFPYPFEPIVFTNASKAHMVNLLALSFEQGKILIPNYRTLLSELEAYECKVNALGIMTFNAPSGFHDDTVCSLMLANAAAQEYVFDSLEVKGINDIKPEETEKHEINFGAWYDKLIEDDDDFGTEIKLL